jgi:heme o synthase
MTGGSHVSSAGSLLWPPAAWTRIFFELAKCHLTGFIALSAVFGQMIGAGFFSMDSLAAGGGVWLLAAGAAVLNNIQDRRYDRGFARTRNRCLARKTIPVRTAALLALALTGAGLTVLFTYPDTFLPGLFGLLALLCYNGLYTPLKKKTFAAVWPGVVCGMLPPAIGWALVPASAAVGTGPDLLMVMLVMGLWQVPHFLALRDGSMVKGSEGMMVKARDGQALGAVLAVESARQAVAGQGIPYPQTIRADGSRSRPREMSVFPCLALKWTRAELQIQVLIWVSLYSLAILLFLIRGGIHSGGLSVVLGGLALVLPAVMAWLQYPNRGGPMMQGFAVLNLSLFVFMVLGILDRAVTGFFPLQ